MSRVVTGKLHYPSGAVIADTKVRFRSFRHNYSLNGASPLHSDVILTINGVGEFSTNLIDGDYEVHVQLGTTYQPMGIIVIDPAELGTVTLGELIDLYRDATGDYSPSGLVTQTWVQNFVGVGGSPADISLLAFDINDGSTPLQQLRKRADDLGYEWFTPAVITPQDVLVEYETAINNQLLQVGHAYRIPESITVTLPTTPAGGWIELIPDGDLVTNPATLNMNGKSMKGDADTTFLYDIKVGLKLVDSTTAFGWSY